MAVAVTPTKKPWDTPRVTSPPLAEQVNKLATTLQLMFVTGLKERLL